VFLASSRRLRAPNAVPGFARGLGCSRRLEVEARLPPRGASYGAELAHRKLSAARRFPSAGPASFAPRMISRARARHRGALVGEAAASLRLMTGSTPTGPGIDRRCPRDAASQLRSWSGASGWAGNPRADTAWSSGIRELTLVSNKRGHSARAWRRDPCLHPSPEVDLAATSGANEDSAPADGAGEVLVEISRRGERRRATCVRRCRSRRSSHRPGLGTVREGRQGGREIEGRRNLCARDPGRCRASCAPRARDHFATSVWRTGATSTR